MQNFNDTKSIVMNKTYDYLDQRNAEFNADFKSFLTHTDELKENIGNMIEKNFDSVWETPQGIRFLTRFEKVSEKIPLTRMDDKYDRILKYCEKEVDRIIKMYKKQKDDPPVPIMFPPIAGRIKWARSLLCHLDELLSSVTTHHVLKNLPATAELSRRHKAAETTLKSYETDMVAIWMNQHICDVDNCLKRNLLSVCPEQQRIKVNLHNTIPLLIREADLMIKMDLPIPMVALTLYSKQEHFGLIKDYLQVQ
jgi:dynein heavy chain